MSDVLSQIRARRTIRRYKDIPIEWDKILDILEAGQWAPSAGNMQAWRFIVVTSQEKRNDLVGACFDQSFVSEAPVVICVCSLPEPVHRLYGARGEMLYSIQESAAAIENMLLVAQDTGLASAWIGAFDEEMVAKVLDVPQEARIHALITLGYARETVPVPPRTSLHHTVFFDKYGNRDKEPSLFPLLRKRHQSLAVEPLINRTKQEENKSETDKNIQHSKKKSPLLKLYSRLSGKK